MSIDLYTYLTYSPGAFNDNWTWRQNETSNSVMCLIQINIRLAALEPLISLVYL